MSSNPPDTIKELSANLKYSYLKLKAGEGGYKSDYKDFVTVWVTEHPDIASSFAKTAFIDACASRWGKKLSNQSPENLSLKLNDDTCPAEIRYKEKGVPGGYRTVLVEFAILWQFYGHYMSVQDNANIQISSAHALQKQYELAYERAGGNMQASVIGLLD